jgi:hypothetical protein
VHTRSHHRAFDRSQRHVRNLRHLHYFVAGAEEQQFSRAAERPNILQPPPSLAILEAADLGVGQPAVLRNKIVGNDAGPAPT